MHQIEYKQNLIPLFEELSMIQRNKLSSLDYNNKNKIHNQYGSLKSKYQGSNNNKKQSKNQSLKSKQIRNFSFADNMFKKQSSNNPYLKEKLIEKGKQNIQQDSDQQIDNDILLRQNLISSESKGLNQTLSVQINQNKSNILKLSQKHQLFKRQMSIYKEKIMVMDKQYLLLKKQEQNIKQKEKKLSKKLKDYKRLNQFITQKSHTSHKQGRQLKKVLQQQKKWLNQQCNQIENIKAKLQELNQRLNDIKYQQELKQEQNLQIEQQRRQTQKLLKQISHLKGKQLQVIKQQSMLTEQCNNLVSHYKQLKNLQLKYQRQYETTVQQKNQLSKDLEESLRDIQQQKSLEQSIRRINMKITHQKQKIITMKQTQSQIYEKTTARKQQIKRLQMILRQMQFKQYLPDDSQWWEDSDRVQYSPNFVRSKNKLPRSMNYPLSTIQERERYHSNQNHSPSPNSFMREQILDSVTQSDVMQPYQQQFQSRQFFVSRNLGQFKSQNSRFAVVQSQEESLGLDMKKRRCQKQQNLSFAQLKKSSIEQNMLNINIPYQNNEFKSVQIQKVKYSPTQRKNKNQLTSQIIMNDKQKLPTFQSQIKQQQSVIQLDSLINQYQNIRSHSCFHEPQQ